VLGACNPGFMPWGWVPSVTFPNVATVGAPALTVPQKSKKVYVVPPQVVR